MGLEQTSARRFQGCACRVTAAVEQRPPDRVWHRGLIRRVTCNRARNTGEDGCDLSCNRFKGVVSVRRLIAILAVSALISGLLLATESSPSYAATSNPGASTDGRTVRVIAGADRYETAVLVSQAGFPQGAPAVVIARGDDFADALCSAPLAYAYGGPLLLTPASGLPETGRGRTGASRSIAGLPHRDGRRVVTGV